VKRVPPVQRAAVVPHEHVTRAPLLTKGELGPRCMRPQLVEQRLALRELQTRHVAVAPPAEEQALAAGFGMRAYDPVMRAGCLSRIGELAIALAHQAGAVIGGV